MKSQYQRIQYLESRLGQLTTLQKRVDKLEKLLQGQASIQRAISDGAMCDAARKLTGR